MQLVVMYDETPIGSCVEIDLDPDGLGFGEVMAFPAYERVRGPFQRFNPYTTWLYVVEWSEIRAREVEAREQAAHLTLRGVDGALFPVRDISVLDISRGEQTSIHIEFRLEDGDASIGAHLPPLPPREGLAGEHQPRTP